VGIHTEELSAQRRSTIVSHRFPRHEPASAASTVEEAREPATRRADAPDFAPMALASVLSTIERRRPPGDLDEK
jgi:hypothetical protein